MIDSTPVVRFAPSPTGTFHVGSARTAIFNWLFAKKTGGKFLLRIEDTDKSRSTQENVDLIVQSMDWLALDWDGEVDFQTRHIERHKSFVDKLLSEGKAYRCSATAADVSTWKKLHGREKGFRGEETSDGAVRLRIPTGDLVVHDLVLGEVRFDSKNIDDYVISRADGTPTYLLASASDDIHDNITHVIRGSDHLSNTPRQLALYKQLGATIPQFAHLPLLNDSDGKKLSKRNLKEGHMTSVEDLMKEGILPDAALNYLSLLGWGNTDNKTLLSREELTAKFSLTKVSKNPSQFDTEKLKWINSKKIKTVDIDDAVKGLGLTKDAPKKAFDNIARIETIFNVSRDKIQTLNQFWDLNSFFFDETFSISDSAKHTWIQVEAKPILIGVHVGLQNIEDWTIYNIRDTLKGIVKGTNLKPKQVFQPVRVAVSGKEIGPGIFELISILGKETVLKRLSDVIEQL